MYKLTFASGIEATREASDMRALLTLLVCVDKVGEPVKVELVPA